MQQVDLGRRVRAVREAEETHRDGERGEGRAEHEIEIRAGGRRDRKLDLQRVNNRARNLILDGENTL